MTTTCKMHNCVRQPLLEDINNTFFNLDFLPNHKKSINLIEKYPNENVGITKLFIDNIDMFLQIDYNTSYFNIWISKDFSKVYFCYRIPKDKKYFFFEYKATHLVNRPYLNDEEIKKILCRNHNNLPENCYFLIPKGDGFVNSKFLTHNTKYLDLINHCERYIDSKIRISGYFRLLHFKVFNGSIRINVSYDYSKIYIRCEYYDVVYIKHYTINENIDEFGDL